MPSTWQPYYQIKEGYRHISPEVLQIIQGALHEAHCISEDNKTDYSCSDELERAKLIAGNFSVEFMEEFLIVEILNERPQLTQVLRIGFKANHY